MSAKVVVVEEGPAVWEVVGIIGCEDAVMDGVCVWNLKLETKSNLNNNNYGPKLNLIQTRFLCAFKREKVVSETLGVF